MLQRTFERGRRWGTAVAVTAFFLILGTPGLVAAQTGTISGRVVDATSLGPVVGAQVQVDGAEVGSLTDGNGRYTIQNVPAGDYTMRVVHIGYRNVTDRPVSVTSGSVTTVNFELATATIDLDEIVVTGTGAPTQRRQLGQTISSVSAEQLTQAPIANVSDALRGRIPGLVSNPMGETGSGAPIRLRGAVSLSQSNSPIIYIDGIRVDNSMQSMAGTNLVTNRLDDLNAGDIERVEVIKGAAAATLYGTEASSGVIQIFTKRGQVGAPVYTFETSQQALVMPDRITPVFAFNAANGQIASSSPGDDFIRTGHHQNYNMSVRGGTESVQYYASGRFMNETGTLPTNKASNRAGRMALDFQHSDRFSTNLDINLIRNVAEAPQPSWGLVGEFVLANPWNVSELRPYGELFNTIPGAIAFSNVQTTDNLTLGGTANYQWMDNLVSRVTLGYNNVDQEVVQSIPVGAGLRDADGVRDLRDRNTTAITADFSTNLEVDLSPSITSTTTVGGQSFWETQESKRVGVRDFPSPSLNTLRGGSTVFAVDESSQEVINAGVFGQQQFGFDNRLFVTVGVRMDGNSAFGENFGMETYPKVGASWVVSEHDFWGFDAWNMLRLRGAYGTSGLQPGAFDAQRTWRPTALVNNDPAVLPQNIGNPDLKPERSTELEFAAELGFLDNRVGIEAVYWSQETTDALLPVQASPSSGFLNTQLQNIGQTESSGIELSADLGVIERSDFRWELNAAYTNTDQLVVDLGGIAPFRLTGARRWHRIQEGFAPGAFIAPAYDPSNPYTVSGGVENLTSLNQISPNFLKNAAGNDSLVYFGDALPNWTATLGSTFSLGSNFSLRTMFSAEGGFVMSNETQLIRQAIGLTEQAANFQQELADPSTSTARRQEIAEIYGSKHPNVISAWVEDGDYVRWAELTATYTVPETISGGLGLGNTQISLGGRNLALFTGYSGIADPGSSSLATSGGATRDFVANVDYFGAPVARRYVFTLRTTL